MSDLPLFRIRTDVVHRVLDGEHFVLTVDNALHTVTDPVGAMILDRLEREPPAGLNDLVAAVRLEFDADRADVEADVLAFLEDLLSRNVLERTSPEVPR